MTNQIKCILKGGLDFYIVEMSAIYEKGMAIFVPDQKLGYLEKVYEGEDMEALYNPNKYRKTNATIVAIPRAMSNEVVETMDVGFPQPKSTLATIGFQNTNVCAVLGRTVTCGQR